MQGKMRPCDKSVFEFMKIRESRWEGSERDRRRRRRRRSVRQIHTGRIGIYGWTGRQDKGQGGSFGRHKL